jgi:hypothetical protein
MRSPVSLAGRPRRGALAGTAHPHPPLHGLSIGSGSPSSGCRALYGACVPSRCPKPRSLPRRPGHLVSPRWAGGGAFAGRRDSSAGKRSPVAAHPLRAWRRSGPVWRICKRGASKKPPHPSRAKGKPHGGLSEAASGKRVAGWAKRRTPE